MPDRLSLSAFPQFPLELGISAKLGSEVTIGAELTGAVPCVDRIFYGWSIVWASFFIIVYVGCITFYGFTAYFEPL